MPNANPSSTPADSPTTAAGAHAPELVVVGAASRDLATDDPRGWRLGGAVSFGALTAARLGLRVGALVGADALAADADELDRLREAGAEVSVARLASGPVFDNVEGPRGRRQLAHAASDPLAPDRLPRAWARAGAWLLGPVANELPGGWADVPPSDAIVAVGWQGLLRDVRAGEPVRRTKPTRSPLLARADLVGVSRDDIAGDVPIAELCGLLRPGATLVVTAGDGGGLVAEVGPDGPRRLHRYPAVATAGSVDPTGAGDAFLVTLLAVRARPGLVGGRLGQRHDLLLAAVVASFVVEAPGLAGVPDRDRVRRRVARAAFGGGGRGGSGGGGAGRVG